MTNLASPVWRIVLRSVLLVLVVAAALFFLARIPRTVEVFLLASLIAFGVNPIVRGLSRRMPRILAVAIVYVGLVLAVLVAGLLIVPETVSQLQNFFANGPRYMTSVQQFVDHMQAALQAQFGRRVLPDQFQNLEGYMLGKVSEGINSAIAGAGGLLLDVANVVVIGITAVILSYYMLSHADDIRNSFYSLFPERSQDGAKRFASEMSRVVGGFVHGQVLLCAFSGVVTFLVLAVFGSNYALLLGVLTGLLYAVPYLGVFVALVIGFALGAIQSWKVAVITFVTIFVVTKAADTVLVPKVMGESVGVSPIAVIFAVFAGGELFGLWGLVLAIPAAALLKVVWNLWAHPWLVERRLASEVAGPPAPPVASPVSSVPVQDA